MAYKGCINDSRIKYVEKKYSLIDILVKDAKNLNKEFEKNNSIIGSINKINLSFKLVFFFFVKQIFFNKIPSYQPNKLYLISCLG